MATKKSTPAASAPQYTVSNCSIVNTTAPANKHTRAAVEALAAAAQANAMAISAIANALKGGDATMRTGIELGGGE
jgi:hypothetical protein